MATPWSGRDKDIENDEHAHDELRDLEARLREGAMRMLMNPPVRQECRTDADCECVPPCWLVRRQREREDAELIEPEEC